MKFSIIIPTINKTEMVAQCIESIYQYSDIDDLEIIIVDDGSEKDVKKYISDLASDKVTVIQKSENTGFSDTVNHGIRKAKGEVIILVNNDVKFTSNVCLSIDKAMNKDPKIGIVGAYLLFGNGLIQHAGMELRFDRIFYHIDKGLKDSQYSKSGRYCPAVTGAVFAIKRQCLDDIGFLDDKYFLSCDDTDYCLRAWQAGWRVWYENTATAIHIEGATRGNDEKSKRAQPAKWLDGEKKSIAYFSQKFAKYDYKGLQENVRALNETIKHTKIQKVEIGSGYNPQPGYIHIDSRRLPGVDHVLNYEVQKLPFLDYSVDEIISNHCIEHISWRSLPFVFKEWHRVLKLGGRVFLRTPDLEFICKTYLAGKTTQEWPGDEKYITDNLSGIVTPSWWANIKLFAGQDYAENYHCLCFDFDMLKKTAEKFGFNKVKRLDIKPVYSPGEIQAEFFK